MVPADRAEPERCEANLRTAREGARTHSRSTLASIGVGGVCIFSSMVCLPARSLLSCEVTVLKF